LVHLLLPWPCQDPRPSSALKCVLRSRVVKLSVPVSVSGVRFSSVKNKTLLPLRMPGLFATTAAFSCIFVLLGCQRIHPLASGAPASTRRLSDTINIGFLAEYSQMRVSNRRSPRLDGGLKSPKIIENNWKLRPWLIVYVHA